MTPTYSSWRRSSRSASSGDCVELRWRRSSRSGQWNCVEVAHATVDGVQVRDSKNARGPRLDLPTAALVSLTTLASGYADVTALRDGDATR